MKTLEECYEINFSKINFLERKTKIQEPKTIIYGASKTGKSYLIYDFLSNFKSNEYLYIDFSDLRNQNLENFTELQFFLNKNNITVLVLENFAFQIEIPDCENIIISSFKKLEIPDFTSIMIQALDFEEYLLHDNKYQNITQSFNNFLKFGNLPEIISLEEHKKTQRIQEIIKLFCKDNTVYEVFKILIENIDEKKSLYQLFNTMKMKMKISKDKFYEICKELELNNKVYFVEKYNQEKSTKKIFCYSYAFLNAITYTKKFKNEFANMVYLELLKENEEIFYLDNIDFYIKSQNLAIICIPFFNSSLNASLLKKIIKTANEFNIKNIEIITVSNNEKIIDNKIKIDVNPFYEWSVG